MHNSIRLNIKAGSVSGEVACIVIFVEFLGAPSLVVTGLPTKCWSTATKGDFVSATRSEAAGAHAQQEDSIPFASIIDYSFLIQSAHVGNCIRGVMNSMSTMASRRRRPRAASLAIGERETIPPCFQ